MNRRKFFSLSALAAVTEVSTFGASNRPIVLSPSGVVQTGGARGIDIGGGHWVWDKEGRRRSNKGIAASWWPRSRSSVF